VLHFTPFSTPLKLLPSFPILLLVRKSDNGNNKITVFAVLSYRDSGFITRYAVSCIPVPSKRPLMLRVRFQSGVYFWRCDLVCGAESLKRYAVRPPACLSQHGPTAANRLLQVCCCEAGGQEISIDCCSSGGRMRAVPLYQRT